MKKFVIGDIHGDYRGLLDVLTEAKFDYENDMLIGLGDYCDGWPETSDVIATLLKIKHFKGVLGNHDSWALDFMDIEMRGDVAKSMNQAREKANWLHHGGEGTYDSYQGKPELWVKHKEWLQSLPYYLEEDGKLFVHAGPVPGQSIETISRLQPSLLIWQRQFVSELPIKPWQDHDELYIGHTPTQVIDYIKHTGEPIQYGNTWFMDTGAAFDGKLSMMNIETKEVFQADESWFYYPDYKGRNQVTYNQYKDLKAKGLV